jgi:hypothetical protein
MAEHFKRCIGGFSLYASGGDNVRFCLARHGEDAAKVVDAFWKEYSRNNPDPRPDFVIVPVFAYGLPPREELCTKTSAIGKRGSIGKSGTIADLMGLKGKPDR